MVITAIKANNGNNKLLDISVLIVPAAETLEILAKTF
jgi:hypothetical protein